MNILRRTVIAVFAVSSFASIGTGVAVAQSSSEFTPAFAHVDENGRTYNCNLDTCWYPDGSFVPMYHWCGVICGEPPTNGDIQGCGATGKSIDDCNALLRQEQLQNYH